MPRFHGSKHLRPTLRNIYGCNKDVNGNFTPSKESRDVTFRTYFTAISNTDTHRMHLARCPRQITAMAMSSKRIAAIAETADHAFVTLYNVAGT